MSEARKTVLVVGLGELPNESHTASDTAIKQGGSTARIRASVENIASEPGIQENYIVEIVFISPGDLPKGIADYQSALLQRKWDGVIIGFGVRGVPEFTQYFEDLVDMTRKLAPQASFGFTEKPEDMKPCILRLGKCMSE